MAIDTSDIERILFDFNRIEFEALSILSSLEKYIS